MVFALCDILVLKGGEIMPEMETRRNDKICLFQMLLVQSRSQVPREFAELISWQKAHMEPEDVKLVMQEFESWKNDL